MELNQIVDLSGLLLFALFFLNNAFMVYIATYKLKEIQSHYQKSRLVASHRGDTSTPIILRTGNPVLIWSLLVFKFFRKMDPYSIEEVKRFPRSLRPWVIIPGHINACCIAWGVGVLVWINIKGYL